MTSEIELAISNAADALLSPWKGDGLAQLAGQHLPDAAGGRHGWLLRADAKLVQLRWVIEAITGPELIGMPPTKARLLVLQRALSLVDAEFDHINQAERASAARILQDIALSLWRARDTTSRVPVSRKDRYALIVSFSDSKPFCWICGIRFTPTAVEAFVEERRFFAGAQLFVDFTYPRGRNKGDEAVTVDHALPVSAGGTNEPENLRLCCAWCNTAKSDNLDIYRSSQYRGVYDHPSLGSFRLPNYSWVSRLLAMTNGCSDCGRKQQDGPLVVASSPAVRQLNPVYLRTYCADHDPWREHRIVPARALPG